MTSRPRVVIAGLGDTGILTAIHLARHADVVGIATKPGLVSGQELGLRLARPAEWARAYRVPFERFRQLDAVRIVHGAATGLDERVRTIHVRTAEGADVEEPFDALVIATGASNGFWRTPTVQDDDEVTRDVAQAHRQLAAADSVIVVGGGAAAISGAWNVAVTWPDKRVDVYFPRERALTHHHPRVWEVLQRRFGERGVGLHPGHRAAIPNGFGDDRITDGPVAWSSGQPDSTADAVLWATGRTRPNTDWIPKKFRDANGFVVVDDYLRVRGVSGVYAIGDVAATDPLRTSARGRADRLLARNIRADLGTGRARRFEPLARRWGSVVGAQDNRLEVFSPAGRPWLIPAWDELRPWLVDRAIYKGIRPE